MTDPCQPGMTGPGEKAVIAAAENSLCDAAFSMAQERIPDVEGSWEEDEFSLPAHELQLLPPSRQIVTLLTSDRVGLLFDVAAILAGYGLGVRSATMTSGEDLALAVIDLESDAQHPADWSQVRSDLRMVLHGQLDEDAKVVRLTAAARARHEPVAIAIDNAKSANTTMVEVHVPSNIGVLCHIAKALTDCQLNISTATICTVDGQEMDVFYVTDASTGSKISDPVGIRDLEDAIRRELGEN